MRQVAPVEMPSIEPPGDVAGIVDEDIDAGGLFRQPRRVLGFGAVVDAGWSRHRSGARAERSRSASALTMVAAGCGRRAGLAPPPRRSAFRRRPRQCLGGAGGSGHACRADADPWNVSLGMRNECQRIWWGMVSAAVNIALQARCARAQFGPLQGDQDRGQLAGRANHRRVFSMTSAKKQYRIAVIPGDGIGKEVVPEGLRIDRGGRQETRRRPPVRSFRLRLRTTITRSTAR